MKIGLLIKALLLLFLVGCSTTPPPRHADNLCQVFRQYPDWYWTAQDVQRHWGLPIHVLMAIIYQESHFSADAQPPRRKLLWIIPWLRPTSAYGYSQALSDTWKRYKKSNNHIFVRRGAFGDAADFIGWYSEEVRQRAHVSKWDAYSLYLAYHEGTGGYIRKTYRSKAWLMAVARKVQSRAWIYRMQLLNCESSLPSKPFWKKLF